MKEFLIAATDGPSIEFDGRVLAALEVDNNVYKLVLEVWETDAGQYVLVRRCICPNGNFDRTGAKVSDNPLADIAFFNADGRARVLLRLAGFEEVVTV